MTVVKEAGTRIFKLYRSSNHWAKLGRENCPHRFFVCFRGGCACVPSVEPPSLTPTLGGRRKTRRSVWLGRQAGSRLRRAMRGRGQSGPGDPACVMSRAYRQCMSRPSSTRRLTPSHIVELEQPQGAYPRSPSGCAAESPSALLRSAHVRPYGPRYRRRDRSVLW